MGVLLSGMLRDGTAGLGAIAARGGCAIVQQPSDALFGDLPRSALRALTNVAVLPSSGIAAALTRWASESARGAGLERLR